MKNIYKKGQAPKGRTQRAREPLRGENLLSKRGQEEMAGFAFIVIIVAVVLIIFLSIAFGSKESATLESFEVESFLQVMLSQTTDCSNGIEYLSVKELIFDCSEAEICEDGRISCNVLDDYLKEISRLSWKTGSDTLGYNLDVIFNEAPLISQITSGNITRNYIGASQSFSKNGNNYAIKFRAYN